MNREEYLESIKPRKKTFDEFLAESRQIYGFWDLNSPYPCNMCFSRGEQKGEKCKKCNGTKSLAKENYETMYQGYFETFSLKDKEFNKISSVINTLTEKQFQNIEKHLPKKIYA